MKNKFHLNSRKSMFLWITCLGINFTVDAQDIVVENLTLSTGVNTYSTNGSITSPSASNKPFTSTGTAQTYFSSGTSTLLLPGFKVENLTGTGLFSASIGLITGPAYICSAPVNYTFTTNSNLPITWSVTGPIQITGGQGTSTVTIQQTGTTTAWGNVCATAGANGTKCMTVSMAQTPSTLVNFSKTYETGSGNTWHYYFAASSTGDDQLQYSTDQITWTTAPNWFYHIYTTTLTTPYTFYTRRFNHGCTGPIRTTSIFYGAGKPLGGDDNALILPTVSVFPNPASEKVTIEIQNSQLSSSVSLYDITGKEVIANSAVLKNGSKYTLDVSALENGIYFTRITSGSTVQNEKIFVNH